LNQSALQFLSFPGKIHLIKTDQELQAVAAEMSLVKEFGFDTETRPSFKKGEVYPVSLVQLATETDVYLIRLRHIRQFDLFKSLFENSEILKVGAAIRDDLKGLQKIFQFTPQNFIELQDLAKKKNLQNMGLKGMTEEVLGQTITKGPKTTNWDAEELTDRQLLYAATDAWIGLTLYKKLIARA